MGATLDVATRVLAGVNAWGDKLTVAPRLPRTWHQVQFTSHFHDTTIQFVIDQHQITATANKPLTIQVVGKDHALAAQKATTITYREER